MRQICKSCPAHNNMSAYHCKGDDENCAEVMRYDEGFEAGFDACRDKACEFYREALCEFVNMLNSVKEGSGGPIDIEKSVTAFREEMTEQVSPN